MKRLLTILFLMTLGVINAQSFRFGTKLGYVNSTFKMEGFKYMKLTSSSKSNIYLAIQAEYFFNQYISGQAEFAMAGLGARNVFGSIAIDKGDNHEGYFDINLHTYSLPLGIKVYPARRVALLGGLNLGFNLMATTQIGKEKIKLNNIKTGNHSLFIGGECRIFKDFFLEARYNFGLSNISEFAPIIRNNYLQIGIGYYFKNL
ncbi:outer membrane beta-barrel protein [Capnocytophaga stomatis]|uniref:outer membrane beta-barrel protein n=1 Tax=Capnocytophaga stomatis TaxID=1848904 RepID=UPI0019522594|nr:outer membrane beta-barrel protein [Capnocytophaga stomatis]